MFLIVLLLLIIILGGCIGAFLVFGKIEKDTERKIEQLTKLNDETK